MIEKIPTGADEQHEKPKIEIWMIDDSRDVSSTWQNMVKIKSPDVIFRTFSRAQDAIEELERRAETSLPHGIIVDGNLDLDRGELSQGPHVVRKIVEMIGDKVLLMAHSSSPDLNEQMMQNGAKHVIQKPAGLKDIESAMKQAKKFAEQKIS